MYSEADYAAAAAKYDVPVPSVKTVILVEANGEGFLPDGRPKILLEAHWFGKLTGYKYNASHPGVSVYTWEEARRLYKGGAREYDRLAEAKGLNESAALQSASWGAGQVMGFNYASLGFGSVQEFVDHVQTASGQLDVMMRYLKVNNLLDDMRGFPDMQYCRSFTAGYNGTGQIDEYSQKIHDTYLQVLNGAVPAPHPSAPAVPTFLHQGSKGDDVKYLQRQLGINPDGDYGPQTEKAVRLFQETHGLYVDGVAGPKTLNAIKENGNV